MKVIYESISVDELKELATNYYGDMVKAVADVDRRVIAIDAELHADLEQELLSEGSSQESLWGYNIYPEADEEDYIEFDSLINIRPRQGNRSRDVEDQNIRKAIISLTDERIRR